jgi:hypothetical protein
MTVKASREGVTVDLGDLAAPVGEFVNDTDLYQETPGAIR